MSSKKRVAFIFGGQSTEHEVSRVSAESVLRNIDRDKFDVVMIGITRDGRWLNYDGPVEKIGCGEWQAIAEARMLAQGQQAGAFADAEESSGSPDTAASQEYAAISAGASAGNILKAAGSVTGTERIDAIFPLLHGRNGEDGTIQGLFELAGIPYVGSGVLGSALGMDKAYARIIFEKEGIPQGKYLVFTSKQIKQDAGLLAKQVECKLTYPCFVKPSNAGSSIGVSKAHDRGELIDALRLASKYDRRILAEEFINGREVECAVLGNDEPIASTVGEIIPSNEFYDYEAKYNSGDSSRVIIPADFPIHTIQEIRNYAVKAFKALDCAGLARVDFFVHKETGKGYINEINTMPGFTSISMYPRLWEASGIPYPKLIEKLIELAIERYNEKSEID